MKNILIAPNSFKECADSTNITQTILSSFQKHLPNEIKKQTAFTVIPISDGGDGFLQVCKAVFNLELISFTVSAPFEDQKIKCEVGYDKLNSIVYIESANALGLKVVPKEKRKPLVLSSKGLGELLIQLNNSVENKKLTINKVVIGIGGTATNDLGLGVCSKFGLELKNKSGALLNVLPKFFDQTASILKPHQSLNFNLEIITDVENPLLGSKGATKTFGEQKGLSKSEIDFIEDGFNHILAELKIGKDIIEQLSGAGGGLAAGLQLFFDAKVKSSKEFVVKDLGINSEKYKFDIVITGEGKFDEQSLFSKGAMIVLDQFSDKNISKFIICGSSSIKESLMSKIKVIEISNFFKSEEESIRKYEMGIDLAVNEIVNNILSKE